MTKKITLLDISRMFLFIVVTSIILTIIEHFISKWHSLLMFVGLIAVYYSFYQMGRESVIDDKNDTDN